MRYWRTLACALALGIGGLAVCGDECLRGGAPAGKETRRAKIDPKSEPSLDAAAPPSGAALPPPPAEPVDLGPPARTFVLPMVQLSPPVVPATYEPPIAPAAEVKPVGPPLAIPAPPSALDLPPPPPTIGPKSDPLTPAPSIKFDNPPIALPPPPPPAPMVPRFDPPAAPMPPPVPPTVSTRTVSSTKPTAAPGQFKLLLRMGGTGQPRFEIRDGDLLLLKVTCDQIELHGAQDGTSTLPGLTAKGKVKLHGSGLDGNCDQLSLVCATGEVALKGGVKLTCYRGTTASQVAAESVMFQLTRTSETSTKRKSAGSTGVVPASLPGPR